MSFSKPEEWQDWKELLSHFKYGEQTDCVIKAMKEGTLLWTPDNSELLIQELSTVATDYLCAAIDNFQRAILKSLFQEKKLILAADRLRNELRTLTEAMDLPVLPNDIRKKFQSDIQLQADNLQSSLKKEAAKDFTGKLKRLLDKYPINKFGGA